MERGRCATADDHVGQGIGGKGDTCTETDTDVSAVFLDFKRRTAGSDVHGTAGIDSRHIDSTAVIYINYSIVIYRSIFKKAAS